jgi:hypothetical protein
MTDSIRTKAKESIESTLEGGQSISQGDMSVSKASLRDAHAVLVEEDTRRAARSGRRPMFRGINMSGVR